MALGKRVLRHHLAFSRAIEKDDKLTTDKVELSVEGNSLNINSNGKYKVPLIFEDDHMVELTPIVIENETANFKIKNEILQSIFNEQCHAQTVFQS